ncbi:MAG: hypothetical protein U9R42_14630 [Bacteroidota bacterium]|nr:hypothetical protein [Bacteroidota bacterium]
MFLKQLLVFIVVMAIVVFLFSLKILFKKKGRFDRSCTAKHRILHEKNLDCKSCNIGPMEHKLDEKEHHSFVRKTN